LFELAEQVGWKFGETADLAKRLSRLRAGLPFEDELAVLLLALGRCKTASSTRSAWLARQRPHRVSDS
jgi:hypothetical protein